MMQNGILFQSRFVSTSNPNEHFGDLTFSGENDNFDKKLIVFLYGSKDSSGDFTYLKGINFKIYKPISKIAFLTEFTLSKVHLWRPEQDLKFKDHVAHVKKDEASEFIEFV